MSMHFPEDDDRCTDPIDEASRTETRMRDNDVAKARAKSKPEQVQVLGKDGFMYWPITECVDCGDDIPDGRLELGRIRCVICQGKKETREKQHGT